MPLRSLFSLFRFCAGYGRKQHSANADRANQKLEQRQPGSFMQPYWKSDSLMFMGKNGVVWGWQPTLDNYKKGYPNKDAMGQLSFDIIMVKKLTDRLLPCNRQVDAEAHHWRCKWSLYVVATSHQRRLENCV